MTKKTLDERIAERKKQSEDRQIFAKADLILRAWGVEKPAKGLGSSLVVFEDKSSGLKVSRETTTTYYDYHPTRYDAEGNWYQDDDPVSSSSVTMQLQISDGAKVVFKTERYYAAADAKAASYVPGAWEENLDATHKALTEQIEKKNAEVAAKRAAAEAKEAAEMAAEQRRIRAREAAAKRKNWGL